MRQHDFAPLYRSTVGFDRLFRLLDNVAAGSEGEAQSYPPYNIERTGENKYRITMALAGFSRDDLNIEVKETTLTVVGKKVDGDEDEREFLHQGIAARGFQRRFQLADHVNVTGADLKDGLLHIDLERVIPESKKPRQIEIASSTVDTAKIEDQTAT